MASDERTENDYMEALDLMSSRGNSKVARSKVNSCLKLTGFNDDEITLLRSLLVGSQCRVKSDDYPVLSRSFTKWDLIGYTQEEDDIDENIEQSKPSVIHSLGQTDMDRLNILISSDLLSLEYRSTLTKVKEVLLSIDSK